MANGIAEEVFSLMKVVITYFGKDKEVLSYTAKLELAKKVNIKRSVYSGFNNGLLSLLHHLFFAIQYWYITTTLSNSEERHTVADITIVKCNAIIIKRNSVLTRNYFLGYYLWTFCI